MNPADLVTVTKSGMYGDFPQRLLDYDGNGNLIYVGIATRGSATSAAKWIIWQLTYNASQQLTSVKVSIPLQIWDNRSSGTYA